MQVFIVDELSVVVWKFDIRIAICMFLLLVDLYVLSQSSSNF